MTDNDHSLYIIQLADRNVIVIPHDELMILAEDHINLCIAEDEDNADEYIVALGVFKDILAQLKPLASPMPPVIEDENE